MVQYPDATLNAVFSALSDPTRRALIRQLAQGESTISELARPFDMSLSAVCKHIRLLESAGLVHKRKVGPSAVCRLGDPARFRLAQQWLRLMDSFWNERLDDLEDFLNHPHSPE